MSGIFLDGKMADLLQKEKIKWMDFDFRQRSRGLLYGGGCCDIKNCGERFLPFRKYFHLDEQRTLNFKEGLACRENRFLIFFVFVVVSAVSSVPMKMDESANGDNMTA
jgi:hypothetical protein